MLRPKALAIVIALAIAGACELAHAQPQKTRWTLEVDSDAPETVSYDALAERVASELGQEGAPVAIVIRYRNAERMLVVRATHEDGRTVERAVRAEGDTEAIRREAVLLAGNVARDEARELLDALSARPPKPAPAPEPTPEAAPETPPTTAKETPAPNEELRVVNGGLAYPIASNFGHPWVTTYFDISLVFGLVGKVKGVQLGSGGVLAPVVRGVQLAPVTIAEDVEGTQLGVINIARRVRGAQVGVINIAEEVDGGAVGVISIHRDAIHPIGWVGNLGYFNAGISFESKWVYTILGINYGTLETELAPRFGQFAAIGTRLRVLAGLDGGLETAFTSVKPGSTDPNATNVWFHQRALVGYRFAPRLRLFAGAGFRAPVVVDEGSHGFRPEFVGGLEL
jgi:hypothetical protein